MSYCTSCASCCQLCGDPDLEDCAECRGEGLSPDEILWAAVSAMVVAAMYAVYRKFQPLLEG